MKWDLCYNPGRSESWEKLAVEYHVAADDLLVSVGGVGGVGVGG